MSELINRWGLSRRKYNTLEQANNFDFRGLRLEMRSRVLINTKTNETVLLSKHERAIYYYIIQYNLSRGKGPTRDEVDSFLNEEKESGGGMNFTMTLHRLNKKLKKIEANFSLNAKPRSDAEYLIVEVE